MSSRQKHRGQHGQDPKLFSSKYLPILNLAVEEFSYLLSRGYGENSSLKLVGDRHRLTKRQRKALWRASCSDEQKTYRQQIALLPEAIKGRSVAIDGYNLLITTEVALSGGIVIHCRDGAYRDIASVHGTYRKVEETLSAFEVIGRCLQDLEVETATWYLDAPISNSGRLKGLMMTLAEQYGFDWQVELVNNPDRAISEAADRVSLSSDGWVIDQSKEWFNMHRFVVNQIPNSNVIRMDGR